MQVAWNKNGSIVKDFLRIVLKLFVGIVSKRSLNVSDVGGSLSSVLEQKGDLKCSLALMYAPNLWRFWSELVSSLQIYFLFIILRLFVAYSSCTKVDTQICTKSIKTYGLLGGHFLKSKSCCFQLSFVFRFGFVWSKDWNVIFRQSTFERTVRTVRIVAQKQRKNCTGMKISL